jgi:hypothetical protein
MDAATILVKTAKGREEIETRKYKLEQRTRTVLITINGKLTVAQLKEQLGMADFDARLDSLLREEFAQPVLDPAARLQQARVEIARQISAALGPAGDGIALKVEGARTIDDLRAYLESRRATLDGALGKDKAAAFWAKVAALTG